MREKTATRSTAAIVPFAWVILIVVYLASVAAPLNQYKVPPVMPVLMQAFQINLVQAGSLVSVFAVTGLLLALPAGIILQRLGPRLAGLIAVGCLAGGSALGAISPNVSLLLGSRVIEGIGMGLMGVVAPATIAAWFPGEKQGTPMGIWATWVPIGTLVMYLAGPALVAVGSWQAVWWFAVAFSLVVMLVYGLLVRWPASAETPEAPRSPGAGSGESNDFLKALANRNIWLLGLEFACFNLAFIGMSTYYPTFLSENRGYSLTAAGWIASISTVVVLISAPLAGRISDRIHSRRLVFTIPFLILGVIMIFPFQATGWQIYLVLALQGLFLGSIPTATFAAASEVMKKPQWAGYGLGVIMLAQNVGVLIGPVLFGQIVKTQSWVAAGLWMIPVCLLGFVSGWMVKIR